MNTTLIRIKPGHQMDGAGEPLGIDSLGQAHTFWKASGHMDIPISLAIKLEKERPQRFEIVDRNLAKKILGEKKQEKVPLPKSKDKVPDRTKEEIKIAQKETSKIEKEIKIKEEKRGILNKHIIDNYMDKNSRGMLNDIDEDKPYLSIEDLKLMEDYEKKHNKRKAVLNKIQEVMIEIKKKLRIP